MSDAAHTDPARPFNRRTPLGRCIALVPQLELLGLVRSLGAVFPGCDGVHGSILAPSFGPADRAPPDTADDARRAWLDALWSELGGGDDALLAVMGRGAPFELARVRATGPFSAWASALLAQPGTVHLFAIAPAADALLKLRVSSTGLRARIVADFRAQLGDVAARSRATREAHAHATRAQLRATLAGLAGVRVVDTAPPSLAAPATLAAAVPWVALEPARHPRGAAGRGSAPWITAQLARLAPGTHGAVWVPQSTTWVALDLAPGAAWLVALWASTPELLVLSGDGERVLALHKAEYDDEAHVLSTAALLDRATSHHALDAALAASDGARVVAQDWLTHVDPAPAFAPARHYARLALRDARDAAVCLEPLQRGGVVAEGEAIALAADGATAQFDLSNGRLAPLAWTRVFVYEPAQWLVDLWATGLDRLLVATSDGKRVLALRRDGDVADAYLGPVHDLRDAALRGLDR